MRKIKFFAFFLVLAILATPAFALQCKTGNDASDECWTTAQLSTNDVAIIAGTIMQYDFTTPTQQGNDADRAAFYVRASTTADSSVIAGVAQKSYSSGDRVQLLVRGKGSLRVNSSTVASGDKIIAQGHSGTLNRGDGVVLKGDLLTSRDRGIAFALESSTSASTIDAFIIIV